MERRLEGGVSDVYVMGRKRLSELIIILLSQPQCDGKCVINVHVNKMYNAGSSSLDRDPGERSNVSLIQRRKGPSKCLSCSAVLVEK